jgi:flagellar hook assembly protein FlgD
LPSAKLILDIEDNILPVNKNFIIAFPNPSKEFNFIIKDAVPAPVSVKIFDISGRIIRQFETDITDSSIPVRWDGNTAGGLEAPSGLYLVKIKTGKRTGNIKIVKN